MTFLYLGIESTEQLCHRLAIEMFDSEEEPISSFDTCNIGLLESALNLPMASYGGVDLYPTLADKAAVLYYSMVKNHAFVNGNKRIATATVLVFIRLNDYWIYQKQSEMLQMAIYVAI